MSLTLGQMLFIGEKECKPKKGIQKNKLKYGELVSIYLNISHRIIFAAFLSLIFCMF